MSITTSFEEPDLPLTLETFADHIQNLIRKFDSDRDHYLSKAYLAEAGPNKFYLLLRLPADSG